MRLVVLCSIVNQCDIDIFLNKYSRWGGVPLWKFSLVKLTERFVYYNAQF